MPNVIEVKNLTKKYKDGHSEAVALNNVTFSIPEGESVAIVGSSGSGKTTLLHMLGGLDNPTSGEIKVAGNHLNKMSDGQLSKFRNETIGFVFQFFYLQDYLNAKENTVIPLILGNKNVHEGYKKAEEILKHLNLESRINHLPNEISGGEMQRIAIARALINNPKLILADEPTGNLDKENAERVLDIFDKIAATGVSVAVITHDQNVASRFKHVIKLDKGKLVA